MQHNTPFPPGVVCSIPTGLELAPLGQCYGSLGIPDRCGVLPMALLHGPHQLFRLRLGLVRRLLQRFLQQPLRLLFGPPIFSPRQIRQDGRQILSDEYLHPHGISFHASGNECRAGASLKNYQKVGGGTFLWLWAPIAPEIPREGGGRNPIGSRQRFLAPRATPPPPSLE